MEGPIQSAGGKVIGSLTQFGMPLYFERRRNFLGQIGNIFEFPLLEIICFHISFCYSQDASFDSFTLFTGLSHFFLAKMGDFLGSGVNTIFIEG